MVAEEECGEAIEDEVDEKNEGMLTGTIEAVSLLVRPGKVETVGLMEEFTKEGVVRLKLVEEVLTGKSTLLLLEFPVWRRGLQEDTGQAEMNLGGMLEEVVVGHANTIVECVTRGLN